MATISFSRSLKIKDDKAARALIDAAGCSRKAIESEDTSERLESGRALAKKRYSR
jgi:hypothetical protein